MSFFSHVWKAVKSVAHSPITQAIAGGVAIVCPAVGIPAVAALAITNKVLTEADKAQKIVNDAGKVVGYRGPPSALAAVKLVTNTVALAKTGDPGAVRAVAAMKLVRAVKKGNPKAIAHVKRLADVHRARVLAARRVCAGYAVNRKTGRLVRRRHAAHAHR